ncbi:MAG: tetratricopeptide repeat protein [Armatimonadetes bacterium]|nr:tetratricopeptide repeat protein [Armatimonadota bacterium]NIM24123.1 tetratricopeptide repeat protein [Armatimonadota bacterium]NIM67978.1 tetratricopeptide repeat protein [Armatimonadota bacterium]NIM76493.1 tetratricopeptide repeat protein [Armatimonadota bacterium]NIN06207.1 tetratricopeptide repeat protein [Armatimonadota bacterium]
MARERSPDLRRLAADGRRLMREGKMDKAREVFLQVLEHLPGERTRARLGYRCGESQIVIRRLKEYPDSLSPNEDLSVEARLALANCCLKCGLVEESIKHLERAVEVCPDRAEAYCELGLAYQKVGRKGLATSALRRALRLNPRLPRAHQGLAQHLVKLERPQEAQKAFRKALRFNPQRHEYYLGLAGCYLQQGQVSEAVKWLQKAVRKFPDTTVVREALADLYQRMGDYCGLLEEAKELIRLNPRNPYPYELLSMACFQGGDLEGAIDSLSRLIYLDPMDPLPRLKLALLLQQKGELSRAMEEYQRIIHISPQGDHAEAAMQAMESLDDFQMEQIIQRAAEDDRFRACLERDPETTLLSRGYRLTEFAMEVLRRLDFGSKPPPEQWEITYH